MTDTIPSRRKFLKASCLTGAALSLTVCGVTAAIPFGHPAELTSHHFGGTTMTNRILIAYATYTGSTLEIATDMGRTLSEAGLSVDVKPVAERPVLDGYRAVLIGSAVQHGQWLPDAMAFVEENQRVLRSLPTLPFCVHIRNTGEDAESRRARLAYLDAVRVLLDPAAEGYFAGRFDRRGAKLLLPGLAARLVPPIDMRDWEAVRAWARAITPVVVG